MPLAAGEIPNLNISKPMIHLTTNAHARYKEAVEKKKKKDTEEKCKSNEKKRVWNQENEL